MCVLCSEFSCRVGNNHQIQRKKREDELAQQTFLFFTFFRCIIPSLRPDIDAINGQDDVYLEFVPILDIYYSCNAIKFISFDPLQPTIPCQTEMSCHHFPNWLAIYQWLSIDIPSKYLRKHVFKQNTMLRNHLKSLIWQHFRANLAYSLCSVP